MDSVGGPAVPSIVQRSAAICSTAMWARKGRRAITALLMRRCNGR